MKLASLVYRRYLESTRLQKNLGHLIEKYAMSALASFSTRLPHQLPSHLYYVDILVMMDEDLMPFYNDQMNCFISHIDAESKDFLEC